MHPLTETEKASKRVDEFQAAAGMIGTPCEGI
jgi:hypothetical protein